MNLLRNIALLLTLACGLGGSGVARAAEPPTPPMPPLQVYPMQFFRELLATNAAGREAILATRSAAQRGLLEKKLADYQRLTPQQREMRLTLTELRYYLVHLLPLAADLRANYLAQLPEKYRPLIAERLRIWDALSPENQSRLLQNEEALAYLVRLEKAPLPPMPPVPPALPTERQLEVEAALGLWSSLSEAQRQSQVSRFQRFFDLTPREQRQVLDTLPEDQRQNTEAFLATFARLPKEQRDKCTAALARFLTLTPPEQMQFLKNAARWQAMTAEERATVRSVLQKVPPMPPLPPDLFQPRGSGLTGVKP